MKVRLCTFTRTGIESELGSDLSAVVLMALRHYSKKLRSGRPPVEPPRFIAGESREEGQVVELALEPDVEEVLVGEAARQGIEVEALAAHSLHVYLAELDLLAAPVRAV